MYNSFFGKRYESKYFVPADHRRPETPHLSQILEIRSLEAPMYPHIHPYGSPQMNALYHIETEPHRKPYGSKEMNALERINAENHHLLPPEILNQISQYVPNRPRLPNEVMNMIDRYIRPKITYPQRGAATRTEKHRNGSHILWDSREKKLERAIRDEHHRMLSAESDSQFAVAMNMDDTPENRERYKREYLPVLRREMRNYEEAQAKKFLLEKEQREEQQRFYRRLYKHE